MKRYLAYAGAVTALAGSAHAAYAADSSDDSLTWYGITLYGTVDIGYTYQNRGTPLNDYFPTGLQYLIQPSNNRSFAIIVGDASVAPPVCASRPPTSVQHRPAFPLP